MDSDAAILTNGTSDGLVVARRLESICDASPKAFRV
jgi:hypothetical protein